MQIYLSVCRACEIVYRLRVTCCQECGGSLEMVRFVEEIRPTPRAVDGLCPNCGRDYFENETIVDGELRCSCARR